MDNVPQFVALETPRELVPAERALLDFLLTSSLAHAEIHEQARVVKVGADCDCGCRSVQLEAGAAAHPATFELSEATYPGRVDAIEITAHGDAADGTLVQLTLHVIDGRIHELEIWDGSLAPTKGRLPLVETLRFEP